jgi:hypothetical protein
MREHTVWSFMYLGTVLIASIPRPHQLLAVVLHPMVSLSAEVSVCLRLTYWNLRGWELTRTTAHVIAQRLVLSLQSVHACHSTRGDQQGMHGGAVGGS